ncbi:glutathione S-transferase [Alphaproteobacteria bacterium]
MLKVYHYSLCPFSRMLRIVLKEKGLDFVLHSENFWERNDDFLLLNPAGTLPVIVIDEEIKNATEIGPIGQELAQDQSIQNTRKDQSAQKKGGRLSEKSVVIRGMYAITEYLEEVYGHIFIKEETAEKKSHIRYLVDWFNNKFYTEVTRYILFEKIIRTVTRNGAPNSLAIRAAKKNIAYHLNYVEYLLGDNAYLCSESPTLADYAAAAQLSTLDFVGDVPWERNPKAKNWYALIKSRPSFKPILLDEIAGITVPACYADPDF